VSADGKVLAAAADDVYVFFRKGAAFDPIPVKLGINETASEWVTNVAVHPSGTWLAACDHSGHVYLTTLTGQGAASKVWDAQAKIPFLSVAMAADANAFVVGGGNDVFVFERDTFGAQDPRRYDTIKDEDAATIPPNKSDGSPQENVRWVATSADGTLITTVANRLKGDTKTGVVLALKPAGSALEEIWRHVLPRNPNSTSIDAAGTLVTVADGFPTIKPAAFYLFDAKTGDKRWDFPTFSMNWPMAISANGNAIVAGSDDGSVYYFKP
jgi:outer membrane protein assembly factor BamB